MKFRNKVPKTVISPFMVAELQKFFVCKSGAIIGAALPLSIVEKKLKELVMKHEKVATQTFRSVLEMIRWFASKQIRNMASIGGNVMTSSPISDLNPVLVSVGAQLKFKVSGGERKVTLDADFFTGYRTNNTVPEEVLIDIFIPFSKENEYCRSMKQSRRRDDDVAIVNAGFSVHIEPKTNVIKKLILAYGGMKDKTILAKRTMQGLIGSEWNEKLMEKALPLLLEDLPLDLSAQGGMVHYRRTLSLSFFFKFYLQVQNERNESKEFEGNLDQEANKLIPMKKKGYSDPTCEYQRPPPSGTQLYSLGTCKSVGQPVVHSSGLKHATGEAAFVDDLPRLENELWAALVLSEKASAKIVAIDVSEATSLKGVVGFYCAKDIPGSNKTGIVIQDEEVFASEEVHYAGEVIGIVVADDRMVAIEATSKIRVTYHELDPVLTVEEAMKKKQIWEPRKIESGNVDEGFKKCDHILKGQMRIGGQEHFYMETQSCVIIPREDGHIEVISATQHLAETQRNVAAVLGVPLNNVVCKTKRLGGGFGGKEIKSGRIASYVAVAVAKTNRPVRIVLDRSEDMRTTGGRHPIKAEWEVGFNKDGSLVALKLDLLANGGYSLDVSDAMAIKAIMHVDNVYRIPNTSVSCTCCRTNLASNTACRGTGAPQSILIMENIITDVACFLNISPHIVREINMHKTSTPVTHYGQKLEKFTVKQCWDEVLKQSNFHQRVEDIKKFNEKNMYVKRGISAVPSKMAVSFGVRMLEQAGAMVHVYDDGSVLLTHGGIEMGQGLHTKMIQVASAALNIPIESINLIETSTDKIPNTSPTAASCSSDLNGMAVKAACEQIMERLEPYRKENPTGSWVDLVKAAYSDRVSLLGTGFYKTPGLIDFDFEKQEGNPISYFTYGAAVSEVEVDTLTGNHTVLCTDIVMDVGQSLNPAIDIGQIEGAFMFGYGLYTLEEMEYTPKGYLITQGPGNYKIPGVRDIPCKFNVSLLKGSSNPRAIYSSRGIGEPPLTLATSVFLAIKDAIHHHRAEGRNENCSELFELNSPATSERIRMACNDRFIRKVCEQNGDNFDGSTWSLRV